ncbi:MAG TPA: hypothetical protein VFC07_16530 [Verrucomicrobiae bacterium]|nr:hypothetical protein [Verrucomicrobiae bacterium]
MTSNDWSMLAALPIGWLSGLAAILAVLNLRRRHDLWKNYLARASVAPVLTVSLANLYGWYFLFGALPVALLVFMAFWLDTRKRFPKG